MATQQLFLVCDMSTLANFKSWAQGISAWFATAGWLQGADTGQVNWSTIAAVPASGTYVYEIWEPNDGLMNFYVKMEYGSVSGFTAPSIRVTLSTATNGAGTATGYVVGPTLLCGTAFSSPGTSTYECDFSGAAGRVGVMLWRNGTASCPQFFGIERSVTAAGAYTGTHVTLAVVGNGPNATQQTLLLAVGAAPASPNGLIARLAKAGVSGTSGAFNGTIPFDTIAPSIGYLDYPLTMCGIGASADFVEGVPFSVTLYSSTRTYMPSHNGPFAGVGPNAASYCAFAARYD